MFAPSSTQTTYGVYCREQAAAVGMNVSDDVRGLIYRYLLRDGPIKQLLLDELQDLHNGAPHWCNEHEGWCFFRRVWIKNTRMYTSAGNMGNATHRVGYLIRIHVPQDVDDLWASDGELEEFFTPPPTPDAQNVHNDMDSSSDQLQHVT